MDNHNAYSKAQIEEVVEYMLLFPEANSCPTIVSLLENIPRKKLINLSLLLVNQYNNRSWFEAIEIFFTFPQSFEVKDFKYRFLRAAKNEVKYIFCTDQTSLELLRYAFSIEYKPGSFEVDECEINVFKAIMLINEKLHVFPNIEDEEDKNLQISKMLIANSFSQKGNDNNDINQIFRETFTKSVDFFEYVKKDKYFLPIYHIFLKKYGITDYRTYIKTILGIYTIMYKNAKYTMETIGEEQWLCNFLYSNEIDRDKIISEFVLEKISIKYDEYVPLINNSDYKIFRNKPLIKYDDNYFGTFNLNFLIEKLFNSLYFDFKNIAENELVRKDFDNEYKEIFFEKTLLVNYIERINENKRYFALTSKQMKDICNEGGESDFYLKSATGDAILIEHKDIKIMAEIKQSRKLDRIINAYKNKLLSKTFSNGKLLENPEPIGIGQLKLLIKKIRDGVFNWDKQIRKDATIYPVLVLTDSDFIPDGLSYLMNSWLQQELAKDDINNSNVKPLIVMTTSIFLLYREEFKLNGLEYYFEEYYASIKRAENKQSANPFVDIINMNIPFSVYMVNTFQNNNFLKIYEEYRLKLLTG